MVKKIGLWVGALLVLMVGGLLSLEPLIMWYLSPPPTFSLALEPKQPDYSQNTFWAAHPNWQDTSDLSPSNIDKSFDFDEPPIDVFFIHSTGYVGPGTWNSTMEKDKAEAQSIEYMLSSMASIFNGCCNVYAPHYREATIHAFVSDNREASYQALDLAYHDVENAFLYYLKHWNNGRPFMIVSHSQGTLHGLRLLALHVDGTPMQSQMVAAYTLGYWLPRDKLDADFTDISLCDSPEQTGCIVSFDTYGEGGGLDNSVRHWYRDGWKEVSEQPTTCVNPLTWKANTQRALATSHPGALPIEFKRDVIDMVLARNPGFVYSELPDVVPNLSWAQCTENGELYIEEQTKGAFANHGNNADKNYHVLDFSLFYASIRKNALDRTYAYLNNVPQGQTEH